MIALVCAAVPLALSEVVGIAKSDAYGYEAVGSAVMRPRPRKSGTEDDDEDVIEPLVLDDPEPDVEVLCELRDVDKTIEVELVVRRELPVAIGIPVAIVILKDEEELDPDEDDEAMAEPLPPVDVDVRLVE